MTARDWYHWGAIAILVVAGISLLVSAWGFIAVGREYRRAWRAGEMLTFGPSRGLPPGIIFTADSLPRVEKERRALAWAIGCFLGCWAVLAVAATVFGPA